jgi:hypothetical protein
MNIINENAANNLGAAIIIQMLKDYFRELSKRDYDSGIAMYCNKDIIKRQLGSEWLFQLTDGLNLAVLNALNNNEEFVEDNVKKMKDV